MRFMDKARVKLISLWNEKQQFREFIRLLNNRANLGLEEPEVRATVEEEFEKYWKEAKAVDVMRRFKAKDDSWWKIVQEIPGHHLQLRFMNQQILEDCTGDYPKVYGGVLWDWDGRVEEYVEFEEYCNKVRAEEDVARQESQRVRRVS